MGEQSLWHGLLEVILAARTGRAIPMLELSRKWTEYGGYTVSSTAQIKGLLRALRDIHQGGVLH